MSQAEVDDTLKRIQEHKGVQGFLIINNDGIPIRSNLEANSTQQYAALIKSLADKSRSAIREIDPTNELVFFRLRTKKHEILVAPEKEYSMIVLQATDASSISSPMIRQPLYHRFSLDRPSPLSPTSYRSPPSLNYRTMAAADHSFDHSAANIKQQLYISFSKPVNK